MNLGSKDVVEKLLWKRADIDRALKNGDSPLIAAIRAGKDEIAEALIDKRPDVNRVSRDGSTALIRAILAGNCSNKLCKFKFSSKWYALIFNLGKKHIVEKLVEKWVDVNKAKDGFSPLFIATLRGMKLFK